MPPRAGLPRPPARSCAPWTPHVARPTTIRCARGYRAEGTSFRWLDRLRLAGLTVAAQGARRIGPTHFGADAFHRAYRGVSAAPVPRRPPLPAGLARWRRGDDVDLAAVGFGRRRRGGLGWLQRSRGVRPLDRPRALPPPP